MKEVDLIVAGSRTVRDYELVKHELDRLTANVTVRSVISGTAYGADKLGERWAEERGIPVRRYPAEWNTHGRAAGIIRNRQMAEAGTALAAFWDGQSRGTAHMIRYAKANGLDVRIIRTDRKQVYPAREETQ